MARPPPEVPTQWSKERGGAANLPTEQILIDDLDKLLQRHCRQLAQRLEAQQQLLERIATAAPSARQSFEPIFPDLEERELFEKVPTAAANQPLTPPGQKEEPRAATPRVRPYKHHGGRDVDLDGSNKLCVTAESTSSPPPTQRSTKSVEGGRGVDLDGSSELFLAEATGASPPTKRSAMRVQEDGRSELGATAEATNRHAGRLEEATSTSPPTKSSATSIQEDGSTVLGATPEATAGPQPREEATVALPPTESKLLESQRSFSSNERSLRERMRHFLNFMPESTRPKPEGKNSIRSDRSDRVDRGLVRERLTRFVNSCFFEGCSCFFILVSVVYFGVETEYMAQNRIEVIPQGFETFSRIIAVIFTLEVLLHVMVEGSAFFTSEFWFANVVDVITVCVTILEIVLDLMQDEDGSPRNLTHIRVIRIVRTIRMLRVVRIMKLFRSLRILVYSVLNTLKSLLWVMVMLLLIIYIFALLFTQAANERIVALGPGNDEAGELEDYFGSLGLSVYTLFKVITGGLAWEEPAAPLETSIGLTWVFVFISFVAFNYLALLNVVMGLVCQTAIESANHDMDVVVQTQLQYQEEYTKKFKDLFKNIDLQNTGILTLKDLEERLQDPGLKDYFAAMDLTTIEAWTLFKLLDANDSSEIDVDEFVTGCLRLRGNARSIDMHMLMYESKWILKQLANMSREQKKGELMLESVDHCLSSADVREAQEAQELVPEEGVDHCFPPAGAAEGQQRRDLWLDEFVDHVKRTS